MGSNTVLWIVLGLIVLVVLWMIMAYNGLVSMRRRADQAYADIDVQLKQRHDLIPNLVETVKGYAKHESGTLEAVIKARNAAINAQGPQAQMTAEQALGASLTKLFGLAEAYPDLKASVNFVELQKELGDVENKIAAARRFLNNSVAEYNAATEQFPAVLIAGMFGFRPKTMFDLGESRQTVETAPSVKF